MHFCSCSAVGQHALELRPFRILFDGHALRLSAAQPSAAHAERHHLDEEQSQCVPDRHSSDRPIKHSVTNPNEQEANGAHQLHAHRSEQVAHMRIRERGQNIHFLADFTASRGGNRTKRITITKRYSHRLECSSHVRRACVSEQCSLIGGKQYAKVKAIHSGYVSAVRAHESPRPERTSTPCLS